MKFFRISFRFKLFLAMMFIVVGVTGSSLFIALKKFEEQYQDRMRESLESQISYFQGLQTARLEQIKTKCLELAGSVRILAALQEGDEEILYETAFDELRSIQDTPLRRAQKVLNQESIPLKAAFFRFLDARGNPIPTRNPRAGLHRAKARQMFESQFSSLAQVMKSPSPQHVGYIAPENDEGIVLLHEMVFTRIEDPETHESLGALIVAFPVTNFGERTMKQTSQLMSGIFMEGQLYSRTIPKELVEPILQQLGPQVKQHHHPGAEGEFEIHSRKVPFTVLFRNINENSAFPPTYQLCVYSQAEVLRNQRKLTLLIAGLGGLGLAGAAVFGWILSHGLYVPISELVKGTREVQKGNYGISIPVRSHDEIGHLTSSFNEMTRDLALKEKYRSILDKVSDREVALQLVSGNLSLGGEVKEVSILFCDIRGFTPLTQNMGAEEVIQLLNEHMTALTRVVYAHGGIVDKFVGDLIMAVFGAPKRGTNDTENAVRCGLALISTREELNQRSRYQIRVGVGISTGSVLAGCMGSEDRLNYTVLGERVNLGSRLCGQARPGEILIDETTYERASNMAHAEPVPDLQLKGIEGPVRAYKILAIKNSTA